MKLTTTLLLIGTLAIFSRKEVGGGYVSKEKDEGYYFWNDTKEFSWFRVNADNTKALGTGTFKVAGDSIILEFGAARKQFDVEEEMWPSPGNESIIVTFQNENNEPLQGLEITLEKSGVKAVTDKNGRATLDTRNAKVDKDEIDIRLGGYRTFGEALTLKGQAYKIKVTADIGRIYKEHQREKYLFSVTKKELVLTGGNVTKEFKNVNRDGFMDLYHGE